MAHSNNKIQAEGMLGVHCTHVDRLTGSFENGSTKGVVLPVHYPKDDLALWASVSSPVTTNKAYSGFFQVLAF